MPQTGPLPRELELELAHLSHAQANVEKPPSFLSPLNLALALSNAHARPQLIPPPDPPPHLPGMPLDFNATLGHSHAHAHPRPQFMGPPDPVPHLPAMAPPLNPALSQSHTHPKPQLIPPPDPAPHLPATTINLAALAAAARQRSRGPEHRSVCAHLYHLLLRSPIARGLIAFYNMPFLPHSNVPPFLPLTRLRFAIFRAFTEPNSKIGVIIFWITLGAVVTSIVSFCLVTLPDARMRAIDGVTNDSDMVLQALDLMCAIIFTADISVRVLCVSAAPINFRERSAFFAHEEWRSVQYSLGAPYPDCLGRISAAAAAGVVVPPATGSDKADLHLHSFVQVRSQAAKALAEPVLPHGFRDPSTNGHSKSEPFTLMSLLLCRRLTGPSATRMVRVFIAYILDPYNIVDIIAIAPFYTDLLGGSSVDTPGLLVLRVLRLLRLSRLVRITGRTAIFRLLQRTLSQSVEALFMLAFFLLIAIIFFGAIVFYCESGTWDPVERMWLRPDVYGTGKEESPFVSIPASMWWGIVTMGTVGYGDLAPTTDVGRFFGSLTIIAGLVVISLPITIIGSNFTDEYSRYRADLRAGGDGFTITLEEHISHSLGINEDEETLETDDDAACATSASTAPPATGSFHSTHGVSSESASAGKRKLSTVASLARFSVGKSAAAGGVAAPLSRPARYWALLRHAVIGRTAPAPGGSAGVEAEEAIALASQQLEVQRAALGLRTAPRAPPRHFTTDEEKRLEVVKRAREAARPVRIRSQPELVRSAAPEVASADVASMTLDQIMSEDRPAYLFLRARKAVDDKGNRLSAVAAVKVTSAEVNAAIDRGVSHRVLMRLKRLDVIAEVDAVDSATGLSREDPVTSSNE